MPVPLPIIRGTSAALYPFTMTISFKTVIGRFQNGSEQRYVVQPSALFSFQLPYAILSQAQKNVIKNAVTGSLGQYGTDLTLTLGPDTYDNLSLDSDSFIGSENKSTYYDAPLSLTQTVTQNYSPGQAGLRFPVLWNGAISTLPYSQKKNFQTIVTKTRPGIKYTSPEFGGGLSGYPTDGLMGWMLSYQRLRDAEFANLKSHFIANWGMAYLFPFVDEDGQSFTVRYGSDDLSFTCSGPDETDVQVSLENTF
jgi:hypothetical protein